MVNMKMWNIILLNPQNLRQREWSCNQGLTSNGTVWPLIRLTCFAQLFLHYPTLNCILPAICIVVCFTDVFDIGIRDSVVAEETGVSIPCVVCQHLHNLHPKRPPILQHQLPYLGSSPLFCLEISRRIVSIIWNSLTQAKVACATRFRSLYAFDVQYMRKLLAEAAPDSWTHRH